MSDEGGRRRPGRPSASSGRPSAVEAVSEAVLKAGSRKVADLAVELELSEVTVRKALDELERRGVLRRFHGEARAYDGDAIPFRMGLHYAEKRRMAELASGLVEGGETILIEAGSAAALLAERLKDRRDLTVLTPNLFIARVFRGSKVRVVVLGGSYQEESESLVGDLAVRSVEELGFSKAFVGVSGFTPTSGFTLNDFSRAEVTRAILARGADNWILTDSSKFGASHAASVCQDLGLLAGLVTDPGIPQESRGLLERAGMRILT